MNYTKEQILMISKGDHEIAAFISSLLDHIHQQNLRIQELERQLGQNSQNSSKPPSSDGLRKANNLRQSGGKKGAPKGHTGHTLKFIDQADEIIVHSLSTCSHCTASLVNVESLAYEKRQVFDLPPPSIYVTEHRAEKKCCPYCYMSQCATFPIGVRAPVQYGEGFAAWTAYFNIYQLLPLERIGQLFADLTGYRPSEATLLSQVEKMADALGPVVQTIRQRLLNSPVMHADETGVRVDGKAYWIHTACNAQWTLLSAHASRGSKGMDDMGILPDYSGHLVHDCYRSYFKDSYTFRHVLCNAHLLRDCQEIEEYDKHKWPTEMKELLQKSWKMTREARAINRSLEEPLIQEIEQRYDDILMRGRTEWMRDAVPDKTGPRGRKSKSKAANLAQRFLDYKVAIIGFLRDDRIPFDNNQAERDIRMVKVKAKISGSFRTQYGAEQFTRIRSFISTLRKQGLPILHSLSSVLRGQFNF